MITLIIASTNPVKIQAASDGFQRLFPGSELNVVAANVPSGVAHQPLSDDETLRGALNRSANAQAVHPNADYWIGIEGGVQPIGGELAAFAWIVVRSTSHIGKARSGTFFLPPAVAGLALRLWKMQLGHTSLLLKMGEVFVPMELAGLSYVGLAMLLRVPQAREIFTPKDAWKVIFEKHRANPQIEHALLKK